MTKKRIFIILFIMANFYAILCGGLYFFQESLIFHPQQLPASYNFQFEHGHQEVWLEASDGARLNGVHFQVENPRGVILYFHGNAGSLMRWGEIAQYFVQKEYSVIIMDYRQFGKSSGKLSEQNLYDDSLLWHTYVKEKYPTTPMTLYGRSLGTTFAAFVASKNKVNRLILETPFYSIEEEARSRFPILPIKKLLKYRFPTYRFINELQTDKITFFHGTEDRVVNYEHGKKLFDAIKTTNKEFVTVPEGGHNNLIEFAAYQEHIDKILEP